MHSKTTKFAVAAQVVIWVLALLIMPSFVFMQHLDLKEALRALPMSLRTIFPLIVFFYANYLWLIPKGLFNGRKTLFYLGNLALVLLNIGRVVLMSPGNELPPEFPFSRISMISMGAVYQIVLQTIATFLAVGVKYMERYYQLKDKAAKQKQEATEAELTWLKSQLNPHFLFNTLNNISSLTQIDADKAQESIGQLSDLLRYALYETDAEKVPLQGEIAFMENYIGLMSLRCNELTRVETDFSVNSKDVMIAPLLFITPIENAFKHGVNARSGSFVSVKLHEDGEDLVFECRNSVFEKSGVDRIGSGIGLNNLRKRLELIYPDKYEYESGENGGEFVSVIRLKGIC